MKHKIDLQKHAAYRFSLFVAASLKFDKMKHLEDKYNQFVDAWITPPTGFSSSINFRLLESFNRWIPEALANNKTVIPFLVSNMLEGDIFSISMYNILSFESNKTDLVLSFEKLDDNPELNKKYFEYGVGEDARAKLTAEYWLKSSDAMTYITNSSYNWKFFGSDCGAVYLYHKNKTHFNTQCTTNREFYNKICKASHSKCIHQETFLDASAVMIQSITIWQQLAITCIAQEILNKAAKVCSYDEMLRFQKQYVAVITEYNNTPNVIMSSSLNLERLESAQAWFVEIKSSKACSVPLLVSNMFKGDIFALNVYDNIYEENDDLIVSYKEINQDSDLYARFTMYNGGEGARAVLSAEHWLASQEAEQLMGETALELREVLKE